MKVGVRFCGGCNPRYNRKEYFEKLMAEYNAYEFEVAMENVKYDCLLVIGGCSSCCASYSQYTFDNLIKVWEPKDSALMFPGEKNE